MERCKSCNGAGSYGGDDVCTDCGGDGTNYDALLRENESLKAKQPRWVSADDDLPDGDSDESYLVVIEKHEGQLSWRTIIYLDWYHGGWDTHRGVITHWMPLPPLPTEVNDE